MHPTQTHPTLIRPNHTLTPPNSLSSTTLLQVKEAETPSVFSFVLPSVYLLVLTLFTTKGYHIPHIPNPNPKPILVWHAKAHHNTSPH